MSPAAETEWSAPLSLDQVGMGGVVTVTSINNNTVYEFTVHV